MTAGPSPTSVAHVITRLDVGGAQETAVRLCVGFDPERFTASIYAGPDAGSGGSLAPTAERGGAEVHTVASLRGPIRPLSDVRAYRALVAAFRSNGPEVVHTHSSKAGVLGRLAARRARVAVVVHTVHGWSFNEAQPAVVAWAYQSIERFLARWTDALVVVTPADERTGLRRRIGRASDYRVVRSGIALARTHPTPDERAASRDVLGWQPNAVVAISVGRLEPQKDPVGLVRAFALAAASNPDLRLVFVGTGELQGAVQEEVDRQGLQERVEFLGLRDDVPALLAAADLFVLGSRWEGLPRAVLEAMAAGLPVVATDTGGVRDVIVDRSTGRLVPIGDARALGDAIVEVVEQPLVAQGWVVAARGALDGFSEERMVADTEALYVELLAEKGRG